MKTICIETWGDAACFTRPEFKVERFSYDVITPAAARGILEAIFWKPAIRYHITKIEVLNPIKWGNITRNEISYVSNKPIIAGERRTLRRTHYLKDVKYRIYANIEFIPVDARKNMSRPAGLDETPQKYYEMFVRRAKKGQCFSQPYFGCREFSAFFKYIDINNDGKLADTISDSRDFGICYYDRNYENNTNILCYMNMINGVIIPKIL